MLKWLNSIRAVSVILVLLLLYVVVIGSMMGKQIQSEVLSLVSAVVTGVVIAYFGKRDENKEK